MRPIRGVAQHYAWGDPSAIPHILGQPADGQPWAEWWLGTHPAAPSHLDGGSLLSQVAGELPYLLKLLAAEKPLSLQTHPDAATAQAGFAREEAAGVPISDPRRVYRDQLAKPELLCALTAFDALCGFRPVGDTEALLHDIGAHQLAMSLRHDGLEATVAGLYRGSIDPAPAIAACARHHSAQAALVTRLHTMYPGEASIPITLLLNRVRLQAGEAIYLEPGNLHAAGFEIEGRGAVVADQRVGHGHDLSSVRRIGEHFLVAHHGRVEHDFAAHFAVGTEATTGVHGAIRQGQLCNWGSHWFP